MDRVDLHDPDSNEEAGQIDSAHPLQPPAPLAGRNHQSLQPKIQQGDAESSVADWRWNPRRSLLSDKYMIDEEPEEMIQHPPSQSQFGEVEQNTQPITPDKPNVCSDSTDGLISWECLASTEDDRWSAPQADPMKSKTKKFNKSSTFSTIRTDAWKNTPENENNIPAAKPTLVSIIADKHRAVADKLQKEQREETLTRWAAFAVRSPPDNHTAQLGKRTGQQLWRILRGRVKCFIYLDAQVHENRKVFGFDAVELQHADGAGVIRDNLSNFQYWWRVGIILVLVYMGISIPYRIGFSREIACYISTWFWLEFAFVNLVLAIDAAVYFAQARDTKVFAADIFAAFPVLHILSFLIGCDSLVETSVAFHMLTLLQLLTKLFRLPNMCQHLRKYEHKNQGNLATQIFGFCQYLLWFLYITHILACVWFFIGGFDSTDGNLKIQGWSSKLPTNASQVHIYLRAFHAINPKLSQVGSGEYEASTNPELIFSIITELGVLPRSHPRPRWCA
jgi:hypothetical protein